MSDLVIQTELLKALAPYIQRCCHALQDISPHGGTEIEGEALTRLDLSAREPVRCGSG